MSSSHTLLSLQFPIRPQEQWLCSLNCFSWRPLSVIRRWSPGTEAQLMLQEGWVSPSPQHKSISHVQRYYDTFSQKPSVEIWIEHTALRISRSLVLGERIFKMPLPGPGRWFMAKTVCYSCRSEFRSVLRTHRLTQPFITQTQEVWNLLLASVGNNTHMDVRTYTWGWEE